MGMDLGRDVGVLGVCRVGVETPFFSGCERVVTCKVNIGWALILGCVKLSHPGMPVFLSSLHEPPSVSLS